MRIGMLFPSTSDARTRGEAQWATTLKGLPAVLAQRGIKTSAYPIARSRETHHGSEQGCLEVAKVFRDSRDFDIIHDWTGGLAAPYSMLVETPVVVSVWDKEKSWFAGDESVGQRLSVLALSSQRDSDEAQPWGMDLSSVPLGAGGPHLVFLGGLGPEGACREAIAFANQAGVPLVLVGRVVDEAYHRETLAAHVGRPVSHIADSASPEADDAIGCARAILFGSDADPTQPLALAEAAARGTPGIALGDVAPPDWFGDRTGIRMMNGDATTAVERVALVERSGCRESVLRAVKLEPMVETIVRHYDHCLANHQRTDQRPWGYFVVLVDDPGYKVKRLVVYPGQRLSLQRHRQRDEHWYLVDGEAAVVVDDEDIRVMRGQALDIPRGCWHRIRNPGAQNLTVIEVQTGDYFGEDDIERAEDDFGRVARR